ncbi:RagB/SusD family nutrient uptake outer membrane protein [Mucilaginibacter flavidus]|uniref:RagB/SusD family nutrient uptake outer membrane protein n=1 Tax=Mucilaginibacter flavidus TaxID=2949309 RepID=UPI0020939B1F|nr:RagB/SusD family nutrient uptake outer membrane protein [Mucilaginibacter flavidus]MCO5948017.1 RagB/SusD family nutrient uptake outer membrane protein [Mucilaginibacter flavidus]
MKRTYIYASLMLLSLAGCKKELIQNPTNAIPAGNAFVTPANFTNAILGTYSALKGGNYYGGQDGGSMATTPDVLSDNLIICSQGRKSEQVFFNFTFNSNSVWNMWPDAYTTVLRANYILTNLGHLSAGTFKDNVQGEALALRALSHFDLLRLYAKSYASAGAQDPGVPYVTSTDPTLLPSRTPDKAAYDMVVADLLQAQPLIAADNGEGRLNKAAVEGLLSRVYLYRGEWQKSADAATACINEAGANGHVLANTDNFGSIWLDGDDPATSEVLFRVKIIDADGIPIGVGYEQSSPQGVKPEYVVDNAFYNLFAANDVRKAAYTGTTVFNSENFVYIKKYFGRATGAANTVDFKALRLGEVYLNRAEAYYNLSQPANALADLNTLRAGRYTGFAAGAETGANLYNAILLQRRLELAFEGSRFFDLKRLNAAIQRSDFGDQAGGAGPQAPVKLIPAGSNLFQMPIPQYEINANRNITQNP